MSEKQTTVVMVINDLCNMTRASLICLRRHYAGKALLADVSRRSGGANKSLAMEFGCALKRLPAFDERQFYAHSTALDFVLPTVKTEFAILLDNDCFVHSDSWESRLFAPFADDAGCVATGPARRGVVKFGGVDCALLGTWSACIRVAAILDTGISVFASGSNVVDDDGKSLQIDTLDANLILAALSGGRAVTVPDIDKYCFHIGAVTTGNYLLNMYERRAQTFRNYFRTLLRFDVDETFPMLHRIMITAYHTSKFFGDGTVSETAYGRFMKEQAGDASKRFEDDFAQRILPRLQEIIPR